MHISEFTLLTDDSKTNERKQAQHAYDDDTNHDTTAHNHQNDDNAPTDNDTLSITATDINVKFNNVADATKTSKPADSESVHADTGDEKERCERKLREPNVVNSRAAALGEAPIRDSDKINVFTRRDVSSTSLLYFYYIISFSLSISLIIIFISSSSLYHYYISSNNKSKYLHPQHAHF